MAEAVVGRKRNPWVVGICNFFFPGLGHLYVGHALRGLTLLGFYFGILILGGAFGIWSTYWGFIFHLAITPLFFFGFLIDGVLLAMKKRDYHLKKYNNWAVYLLAILVIFGTYTTIEWKLPEILGYSVHEIPTYTMSPTLNCGDYIVVDRGVDGRENPRFGEVVVFRYPLDTTKLYVMRVVAIGGDTIEIVNDQVFINGEQVEEPYVRKKETRGSGIDMEPSTIPNGELFTLGDNRSQSKDSRYWGNVPVKNVVGRLSFVLWSRGCDPGRFLP